MQLLCADSIRDGLMLSQHDLNSGVSEWTEEINAAFLSVSPTDQKPKDFGNDPAFNHKQHVNGGKVLPSGSQRLHSLVSPTHFNGNTVSRGMPVALLYTCSSTRNKPVAAV